MTVFICPDCHRMFNLPGREEIKISCPKCGHDYAYKIENWTKLSAQEREDLKYFTERELMSFVDSYDVRRPMDPRTARERRVLSEKLSSVLVTTTDIKDDYEVLGFIDIDTEYQNGSDLSVLQQKAYNMGADAVVGVRSSIYALSIRNGEDTVMMEHLYGTAVKYK